MRSTTSQRSIIELREFVTEQVSTEQLSHEHGEELWRQFGDRVAVEFPSAKTGGQWQLTSLGWVGSIPLAPDLRLMLLPKVQLGNLFRMLEYAYRLESFHLLDGIIECKSLEDLYERLAIILAHRVLDRSRKGFYRTYISETDRLPYVRGTLDVGQLMRSPWSVDLQCHYQEHTSDVEENQILAWTLFTIARSAAMDSERALKPVRAAYRALQGSVRLQPQTARVCIGRLYNRLNYDYESFHALCRFFLEQSGPSYEQGDRKMLPFLVNMARLYELFVAEWLKKHLPDRYRLVAQERVNLGEGENLTINIDLVLYDRRTEQPVAVLDTKYKTADTPSSEDLSQIVSYAAAKGCQSGVLIYPAALQHPFDACYGASDIHVRTLKFTLDGDLEAAGEIFLGELLGAID